MAVIDPDDLPIESLREDTSCTFAHKLIAEQNKTSGLLVGGVGGAGWKACPYCGVMCEPKMSVGYIPGPLWGIGRGWVSPRTYRKWTAIAVFFKGKFG